MENRAKRGCERLLAMWRGRRLTDDSVPLVWRLAHGGRGRSYRILIDGIPYPEVVRVELDFGPLASQAVPDHGG